MNKFNSLSFEQFKSARFVLAVCVLIYFIIGLSLIQNYLYILNTDGISYIHIAQHYINGRFSYAVNGYWSPLYSWHMIPFLMFAKDKVEILFSIKLLSLLIGCFTFFGVYLLGDKFNFDIKVKAVTLVTLIPLILYFAFSKTTPDLLVLTVLIFYLNFLLDPKYVNNSGMGLLAGFCGAVAFLAKSYVFFFFLVHFIIVNIDYWSKFKKHRKNITKNFVLGLVVFLFISGIWVAIISEKYDRFTIGTSGTYNFAAFGPDSGPPIYYDGLLKPHDGYALSVWDDPSYLKVKEWSPFSSIRNFDFELQVIYYDMLEIFKIIESFSVLSIFIIILALLLIFKSSNVSSKNEISLIMLTILVYSAGYCLIFVEARYLWFIDVLLLLLGAFSIRVLSEEYSINKNISMILIFLVSFSFIIYPVFNLYDTSSNGEGTYNLAEKLKKYDVQESNIAATSADWRESLILSYYLDAKYYGLTKPLSSEKEISEELHSNNIKYYILWSNKSVNIQGYEKLEDTGFVYPQVYQLSEV